MQINGTLILLYFIEMLPCMVSDGESHPQEVFFFFKFLLGQGPFCGATVLDFI